VIGPNGEMLGVLTLAEALRAAMKAGMDLVEVNPKSDPPLCKILDLKKYRYADKRRRGPPPKDEPPEGA
jgi:translation initiation factor IF-3